jgi:hypothetical protein
MRMTVRKILLVFRVLLVVTVTTADASMVQETPEAFIVDNGMFTVSIERSTGKIKHAYLNEDWSRLDLVTGYPSYALFFPEFTIMRTDSTADGYYPDRTDTRVSITQVVDRPEIAVIRVLWESGWADVSWTYRFVRGVPYFIVYTERTVRRSAIFTNAQQVVMVTPEVDDSYVVDYEGRWIPTMINRTFPALGALVNSEYSMFTAIDHGRGNRYPAVAWHNDWRDITIGILATSVTPNQRETISYLGGGRSLRDLGGFGEFQFNWFGKSDTESLFLRGGTRYGMELYYSIDRGGPDRFDAFNTALFNERHYDVERSENYAVASVGGRRQSHPLTSWNYPQATSIYFTTQELGRHKAISIPRSQNGTRDPQIVNLSVRMRSRGTAEAVDLAPIEPERITHRRATTVTAGNRMVGEMTWNVRGLDNTLRYVVFDDSDKLTVEGRIEATTGVVIQDLWVDLDYSPRVTEVAQFDDGNGWDIQCLDPVFGTVGLAVYGMEEVAEVVNTGTSLRLFLVTGSRPTVFQKQKVWSYRFLIYPHLETTVWSVDEITPLHDTPERFYREYYKTLPGLEDHPEIGMRPAPQAIAYAAALNPEETTTVRVNLQTDRGRYPLRFFLEGMVVEGVRDNGKLLPSTDWSFDRDRGVLTVETDWDTDVAELDITAGMAPVVTVVGERKGEDDQKGRANGAVGQGKREEAEDPTGFAVARNWPNPFNEATMIRCDVPRNRGSETIRLTIYDLTGRCVRRLVEGSGGVGVWKNGRMEEWKNGRMEEQEKKEMGETFRVIWDGRDDTGRLVGTGVYLYRVEVGGRGIVTKKMMLVR